MIHSIRQLFHETLREQKNNCIGIIRVPKPFYANARVASTKWKKAKNKQTGNIRSFFPTRPLSFAPNAYTHKQTYEYEANITALRFWLFIVCIYAYAVYLTLSEQVLRFPSSGGKNINISKIKNEIFPWRESRTPACTFLHAHKHNETCERLRREFRR